MPPRSSPRRTNLPLSSDWETGDDERQQQEQQQQQQLWLTDSQHFSCFDIKWELPTNLHDDEDEDNDEKHHHHKSIQENDIVQRYFDYKRYHRLQRQQHHHHQLPRRQRVGPINRTSHDIIKTDYDEYDLPAGNRKQQQQRYRHYENFEMLRELLSSDLLCNIWDVSEVFSLTCDLEAAVEVSFCVTEHRHPMNQTRGVFRFELIIVTTSNFNYSSSKRTSYRIELDGERDPDSEWPRYRYRMSQRQQDLIRKDVLTILQWTDMPHLRHVTVAGVGIHVPGFYHDLMKDTLDDRKCYCSSTSSSIITYLQQLNSMSIEFHHLLADLTTRPKRRTRSDRTKYRKKSCTTTTTTTTTTTNEQTVIWLLEQWEGLDRIGLDLHGVSKATAPLCAMLIDSLKRLKSLSLHLPTQQTASIVLPWIVPALHGCLRLEQFVWKGGRSTSSIVAATAQQQQQLYEHDDDYNRSSNIHHNSNGSGSNNNNSSGSSSGPSSAHNPSNMFLPDHRLMESLLGAVCQLPRLRSLNASWDRPPSLSSITRQQQPLLLEDDDDDEWMLTPKQMTILLEGLRHKARHLEDLTLGPISKENIPELQKYLHMNQTLMSLKLTFADYAAEVVVINDPRNHNHTGELIREEPSSLDRITPILQSLKRHPTVTDIRLVNIANLSKRTALALQDMVRYNPCLRSIAFGLAPSTNTLSTVEHQIKKKEFYDVLPNVFRDHHSDAFAHVRGDDAAYGSRCGHHQTALQNFELFGLEQVTKDVALSLSRVWSTNYPSLSSCTLGFRCCLSQAASNQLCAGLAFNSNVKRLHLDGPVPPEALQEFCALVETSNHKLGVLTFDRPRVKNPYGQRTTATGTQARRIDARKIKLMHQLERRLEMNLKLNRFDGRAYHDPKFDQRLLSHLIHRLTSSTKKPYSRTSTHRRPVMDKEQQLGAVFSMLVDRPDWIPSSATIPTHLKD